MGRPLRLGSSLLGSFGMIPVVDRVPFVFVQNRALLNRQLASHVKLIGHLRDAGEIQEVQSVAADFEGWLEETGAQLGFANVEGDQLEDFTLWAKTGSMFSSWDVPEESPEVIQRWEVALREALRAR